jgi:hypothetical protein
MEMSEESKACQIVNQKISNTLEVAIGANQFPENPRESIFAKGQ